MIDETEVLRRLTGMEAQMGEVARDIKEMRADMRQVRRVIWEGNGQPPLAHQVRSNAEKIDQHLNETNVRHQQDSDRKWDLRRTFIASAITFVATVAVTILTIYITGGRP